MTTVFSFQYSSILAKNTHQVHIDQSVETYISNTTDLSADTVPRWALYILFLFAILQSYNFILTYVFNYIVIL